MYSLNTFICIQFICIICIHIIHINYVNLNECVCVYSFKLMKLINAKEAF